MSASKSTHNPVDLVTLPVVVLKNPEVLTVLGASPPVLYGAPPPQCGLTRGGTMQAFFIH